MPHKYVFKKVWKRDLAACFDFVCGLLTFWMARNQPIPPVKKILLARIDHLGDALLLRPALLKLRMTHPEYQLHLLTTPENELIFSGDTFIDKVIPFSGHWFEKRTRWYKKLICFIKMVENIRREKYDVAIDFRGDARMIALFFLAGIPIRIGYGITGGGWMLTHEQLWNDQAHQVELNAEILKSWISFDNLSNPPVRYPENTQMRLNEKIKGEVANPYAVIHAGAGNPLKEWPWNHFAELIKRLLQLERVNTVFLIGTRSEKKHAPFPSRKGVIDLRGLTDLQEVACLMAGAAFFVGNDSGPAHLAAAQGIPIIILASRTNNIALWHPWTTNLSIVPPDETGLISVDRVEQAINAALKNEAKK